MMRLIVTQIVALILMKNKTKRKNKRLLQMTMDGTKCLKTDRQDVQGNANNSLKSTGRRNRLGSKQLNKNKKLRKHPKRLFLICLLRKSKLKEKKVLIVALIVKEKAVNGSLKIIYIDIFHRDSL